MEERQIGATELRQKLTDVIQAVKEEKVAYVVETFGRPQVAVVSIEEYRRWQETNQIDAQTRESARSAFGMWAERPELDDEWRQRNREQWYSAWVKDDRDDE